ncbi:hypothetical protein [Pseudophaeobacter sp.]
MIWLALYSWPVIAYIFFRKWSIPVATSATLIGGYLLLPENHAFDLPLLPPLDKHTIPALSALVLIWINSKDRKTPVDMRPGLLPHSKVVALLLVVMLFGTFATVMTNREPLFYGPTVLASMRVYDSFSILMATILTLIPFLIGRKVLSTQDGLKSFVTVFVMAAVGYACLALWEIRMSPQLNYQIYGFFPHSWIQHIRGGGFRPLVFLEHGLWLGIFFASAILIAFGQWRYETGKRKQQYLMAAGWLFLTISLSKVIGAFAIVLVLLPVMLFLGRRIQLMIAAIISIIVLFYPVLRNVDLVPTDTLLTYAERFDPARAQSLKFRFDNEDKLLARAKLKPLYGWGGYGRNFVFDEDGINTAVSDGLWVILFGKGGWFSYIGHYGLLTWGILALFLRKREEVDNTTAIIALALTGNLIDLLPNAGISPVTWMMAGALVGRLEQRGLVRDNESALIQPTRRPLRYTRDLGQKDTRNKARFVSQNQSINRDGTQDKYRPLGATDRIPYGGG